MLSTVIPIAAFLSLATFALQSSATPVADPSVAAAHHSAPATAQPKPTKRCGASGGGWGVPFANAFNNNVGYACSHCNSNENTLYTSNANACQACDNVHGNNSAFTSFRKRCGCGGVGCGACFGWPWYCGYGSGSYGCYGGYACPGYLY
ncbi:hypothetical protein DL89DRAFT_260451 [Linderina pennispora]|uniref:Uncharacterized protein n=1 Tax=Linderina pennispora TaxID=61395 RepID=A0A1Y1VY02_9FUNG|nr:uncharacterized protein DL89DRAFT_260451 [Linderina pennispora]ORX66160.1 hypothetical protein DL89DRAFT_260451 [Linderina pennispora]